MRKIINIVGVEERTSKDGDPYTITHCLTQDGDECEYYGTDIKEGDEVMVFLHYGKIKCAKKT